MKEGHFLNGEPNGYARILEKSTAEVGYFRYGWPFGKFQVYKDGFLVKQGIIDEINIENGDPFVKQKQILTFENNEDPTFVEADKNGTNSANIYYKKEELSEDEQNKNKNNNP
jgi:hypothetical protein